MKNGLFPNEGLEFFGLQIIRLRRENDKNFT